MLSRIHCWTSCSFANVHVPSHHAKCPIVNLHVSRFEKRGYKLVALKMQTATKEHLENHYSDLSSKSFFPGLFKYMASGPVIAMVWEG